MSVAMQAKQDNIDHVLDKIKQAIEKGSGSSFDYVSAAQVHGQENVLELSDAIDGEDCQAICDSSQLNALIKNFTQRVNDQAGNHVISDRAVETIFKEMLRPYLRSWLNSNLQALVKPVLQAEVRIILKKLFQ
jgi:cell pole-organizing protein PopZ